MPSVFVSIDGIPEDFLAFLGYDLISQDSEFKLYRHSYTGEEQIVDINRPLLLVDDINDAHILGSRSTRKEIIGAPPRPKSDL